MRRLTSILLLVVFGLTFMVPMLAMGQDSEAGLPACCRRNGKHHCMMSTDARGRLVSDHGPELKAPVEKCPYWPNSVAPASLDGLAEPSLAGAYDGNLISHPTGIAQTEARRRVARYRSHHKRGPPQLTSL